MNMELLICEGPCNKFLSIIRNVTLWKVFISLPIFQIENQNMHQGKIHLMMNLIPQPACGISIKMKVSYMLIFLNLATAATMIERIVHFINLPGTELQSSRDKLVPTFIFSIMTDTEFGRKSDNKRRALSKATWYIYINDTDPFLWLPNCSRNSGSSSTFDETNKNVLLFVFCFQMTLIQSTFHIWLVTLVTSERLLDWARPQSSYGGDYSGRPGHALWSACH